MIALSAFLIVAPFILLPLWAVTIPAMVAERLDFGVAFSRSAELTRHRRLPILLAFLLWALILVAGSAVIDLALGGGGLARLAVWIYGAAAATVVYPLPTVLYILLREEKEGAMPAQIAAPVE